MEDKKFIARLLHAHADSLTQFVNRQSEESFSKSINNTWSVGQNVDHLIRSLSPVNQALLLPSFMLRFVFGKPNRPSRTYQELVDRYHIKLSAGVTASGRFIPPVVSWAQKSKSLDEFNLQVKRMIKRLASWSENQLDHYLLPHPLLGKITLREMLFFSAYHIQHHLRLLEERKKS